MKKITILISLALIFLISFSLISLAEDFDLDVDSTILIEADTGQVLYEKNSQEKLPPASITKIMTLLIAMEKIENGKIALDDEITISRYAESMGGSQIFLSANTRVKLEDLLKAISIASANDASVAVAEAIAGTYSNFVNMMNKKAKELGMESTHFVNSTGLPAENGEHYSTAADIAKMSKELVKHPLIFKWSTIWVDYLNLPNRKAMLVNTNKLINKYPGMDGLKTGHTNDAGFCLASTAQKEDMRLITVVLNADTEKEREELTIKLLDYGFNNFSKMRLVNKGEKIQSIKVPEAKETITSGVIADELDVVVKRGSENALKTVIEINQPIKPPVKKGEVIGRKKIIYDDKTINYVNILAAEDIEKANIFIRIWRSFVNWIGSWLKKI